MNIVKFKETFESLDFIYIVTELIEDGDLYRYIIQKDYLEEYEASFIMYNLLNVLKYIHDSGIVHRDLKPENIMIIKDKYINEVRNIKLIDFGFACYVNGNEYLKETVGTPNYLAPEVYLEEYDKRSDIFSLGVIMYFMLSGNLPFNSVTLNGIINRTIEGDYQILDPHWGNITDIGKDLLKKLLEKDKNKRITILDALTHPWIKNREKLNSKGIKGINQEIKLNI